jgi:uncharacterized repeat protein (TIGR01451 family)
MGTRRRVLQIAWIVLGVGVACFSLFFALQAGQARPAAELHVCPSGCAYASVQAAVDAAQEGDVIKVAAGVYTGVESRSAPIGYPGPAVITQVVYVSKTITLEGGYTTTNWATSYPITQPTTLDAQGQGRVLFIAGDISPTIQGLHITGGNANGLGGIASYGIYDAGGGAYIITATATFRNNCVVSNTVNTVRDYGGGLHLTKSNALLTANTISANSAETGGGLSLFGGHATLIGNTITANHAGEGGGLSLWYDYTTLTGNTISNNTASPWESGGGGLVLVLSHAKLTGNTIISNTTDGLGGGLYLDNGLVTLQGNTIMSNTAFDGGGLSIESGGATLEGNTIAFNTARRTGNFSIPGVGGGLYLYDATISFHSNIIISNVTDGEGGGLSVYASNATLANNIIAGNQAGEKGSGINIYAGSSLRFVHTTVASNTGGDGSGINVGDGGSTVILTDTILAGQQIGLAVGAGSAATLESTLWGTGAWANTADWGGAGTILTGTHNIWGNPAFVNPGGNDYHLGETSAARDAGIDAGVRHDVDGQMRPMGWGYDLGADEYLDTGLNMAMQPSSDVVNRGATLTYTLVVTNEGTRGATGVALTETLDTWQRVITTTSSLGGCSIIDGNWGGLVVCSPGAIVAGAVAQVTLVTQVSSTAPLRQALTNTVVVRANETMNKTQATPVVQDCHVRLNDAITEYMSVQDAVNAANTGDLVKVAGLCMGIGEQNGLRQQVYLDRTLTIRGGYTTTNWSSSDPSANPTILDALGRGRVFYVTRDISPTIEGLHIVGGNAMGLGGYESEFSTEDFAPGGGLYLLDNHTTLRANTITSNTANFGGGVYLLGSDAVLEGNTVSYNTAVHPDYSGEVARGGGLYLSGSNATLRGNTISSNSAEDGGGLMVNGNTPTLIGNIFVNNSASDGGGLYLSGSNATLRENAISSNSAKNGGGLMVDGNAPALLGNIFVNNSADFGGGLELTGDHSVLTNNIIVDNSSGGLLTFGSSSQWRHTTFARNAGSCGICLESQYLPEGGWQGSRVAMTNTILVSHTLGIEADWGCTATLEATLWGAGAWANTTDWEGVGFPIGTIITGTRNHWGNPGFINPDAGNYHLGLDSAAIDVGVDAGVTTDRDGVARPQGNGFDLGAYEYVPLLGLARSQKSVSPDTASAGDELTYTLVLRNDGIMTPTETVLVDALPTVTTFISGSGRVTSGAFTVTANLLNWSVSLQPDVPETLTFHAILSESLPVQNTAVVTDRTGASVTLSAWVNARRVYLPVLASSLQRQRPPVVFSTDRDGNREIYTLNVDTLKQTRLTTNNAVDDSPSWSPDGSRIAFMSERDGNREIYVMQADGSNQTRLTRNPAQDEMPAWSPDGQRIVFVSNRDGNREIYVMNADGSGQTRLTDNPAQDDMPAWSPDGAHIVFSSNRDGNYQLYVMRADGTQQTRLTHNAADDLFPAWSPDGQRIAFDSNRDGNRNIYVMNVDSSGQTRVTDNPAEDGDPSWSLDGQRMVFASQRSGNWELYMMDADGSHLTRLTFSWDTNWAPDW